LEEEEKAGYEEGCLSVPSFYEEVMRPVNVEISFNDLDGKENKIKPAGLLGVVIQHETDHLDGKLMVDYISSTKRERIRSKLLRLKKQKK
jgi:peptide deformylase